MKIMGLHWLGHLGYLVALITLGFYAKYRLTEVTTVQQHLAQIEPELRVLDHNEQDLYGQVSTLSQTCPTLNNKDQREKIRKVIGTVDAFSSTCEERIKNMQRDQPINKTDWIKPLVNNYLQVGNLLNSLSKPDSGATLLSSSLIFDPTWTADRLYKLLSSADNADVGWLLQNMQLRLHVALQESMRVISGKMQRNIPLDFSSGLPAFSCEHPPRVGKPFHADLFVMAYPKNPQTWSITATINKKSIPVVQGIAHYETTFKSAGEHKLPVVFFTKNELTGEVRHYEKVFSVPVERE